MTNRPTALQSLKQMLECQDAARQLRDYASDLQLLDERELRLIQNCKQYERHDPAGLPGHNLAIIVAKLARLLGM